MASQPQRWYPPSFATAKTVDPVDIDVALLTAFQNIYGLEQAAVAGAVNGMAMASGSATVTGVQKGIATGLLTVANVVVSIDNGATAFNEWVSASPSIPVKGAVDIYVWAPTAAGNVTPIASTTPRLVRWIATGTLPVNANP